MNPKTMTKEDVKKEIAILKQHIEAKELVFQGLLDILDELNGIKEDE